MYLCIYVFVFVFVYVFVYLILYVFVYMFICVFICIFVSTVTLNITNYRPLFVQSELIFYYQLPSSVWMIKTVSNGQTKRL